MPQSRSAYGALPNPPPLPQQQNPIAPRPSQKSELDKGKDIIEIWKMPAYFGLSAVQKLGETPDTHRAPRVRKSSRRAFALLPPRRRRYIYIYISSSRLTCPPSVLVVLTNARSHRGGNSSSSSYLSGARLLRGEFTVRVGTSTSEVFFVG